MLRLKLNHVSKRGPRTCNLDPNWVITIHTGVPKYEGARPLADTILIEICFVQRLFSYQWFQARQQRTLFNMADEISRNLMPLGVLRPSNAICRQRSTLAQAMACYHHLNQCWFITRVAQVHHLAPTILAMPQSYLAGCGELLISNINVSCHQRHLGHCLVLGSKKSSAMKSHFIVSLTHLPLVPHICLRESGEHWFRSRLFGAKPLSKPMLDYRQLDPNEQTSVKFFIKIQNFSFMKMSIKISSAKWRPFCPEGDELSVVN